MTIRRKKRPKSVYAKGWETRRRNAAATLEGKTIGEARQELTSQLNRLVEASAEARQTPVDAIARTLDLNRDEQLCCFLGDLSAMRSSGQLRGHFPVMLSRSQAEAIETFLTDHGYSPFGKGSGRYASVSTNPNVESQAFTSKATLKAA